MDDVFKKIDQYFDSVSDEKFVEDLRKAGFTVLATSDLYRAEGQASIPYAQRKAPYTFKNTTNVFFYPDSEPAA